MTIAPHLCAFTMTARVIMAILATTLSAHAIASEGRSIITENATIISESVAIDRVKIATKNPDGQLIESTLTFLQIVPKANPEYVCLATLDRGKVQDMDCFPRKTSLTPIMY